ncbi:AMP-binding protein [Arthrobacter sp. zg-Y769]|uniref:AMP-binding protein n=1 Tax=Arthrobacter sp. zg-Y769 TaxID=2894191 RepID=UPI003FA4204E
MEPAKPNLASILSDSAARSPDSPALRIGDSVMTYAALVELSARAAGSLAALGIGSGDRVGFLLPRATSTLSVVWRTDGPAPQNFCRRVWQRA